LLQLFFSRDPRGSGVAPYSIARYEEEHERYEGGSSANGELSEAVGHDVPFRSGGVVLASEWIR
jgi:hypothetical protein